MGHYAKVTNGKVTNVIVAEQDFVDNYVDNIPGRWVKTSFNIYGGVYYGSNGQAVSNQAEAIAEDEGRQRKNFAAVGFNYDGTGFYEPQPYDSWTLNSSTYQWEAPAAYPDDGNIYEWNEEAQTWDAVN
jgi:predicted nucleic acid-binding Zn ribbon protein